MKVKILLIIAIAAAMCQSVVGQVSLNLEWKKNVYPVQIIGAVFSADGNYIFSAIGNSIQKMDAKTGEFLSVFDKADTLPYSAIDELYITPSGNYILTRDDGGVAKIWDTRIEKAIFQLSIVNKPGYDGIRACSISPDEKYLLLGVSVYVGGVDYNAFLVQYDINLQKEIRRIPMGFEYGEITKIAISNDGRYFVTGSIYQEQTMDKFWHDRLILWDTETITPIDTLEDIQTGNSSGGYRQLKFSYNNQYLGCLRISPIEVHIYDVKTNIRVKSSDGRSCLGFEFLPDSLSYLLAYYPFPEFYELNSNKYIGKADRWMGVLTSSTKTKQILAVNGDSLFLYSLPFTSVTDLLTSSPSFKINSLNGFIVFENKTLFGDINFAISDILGKQIYEEKLITVMPNNIYQLKAALPSGLYICNITTKNKEYSQKIEIVR